MACDYDDDCGDPKHPTPALFFEDAPSDEEFDLNLPPCSGAEYLRRVQLEARQCPDVMVAEIDQSHFAGKQTVKVNAGNGCCPAPQGCAPSKSWQELQIADFSELRMNMTRYKFGMKKSKADAVRETMPEANDDVGWGRFCFGDRFMRSLESEEVVAGSSASTEDTSSSDDDGVLPLVSVVAAMSQPLIEQVLEYHINWFDGTDFAVRQGRWFFALLTCLEKPLTPEACSAIRTLARKCAKLRASIVKDDVILSHLNLLICIVAGYFNQSDLADT